MSSGDRLHTSGEALDDLEAQQREEAPAPGALFERETRSVRIPAHGALPQSEELLARLYAGELVPREKKPLVVDTRRSFGPYMASVDANPLVVLDACSQIATLTHGFANPHIVRALYEGRFGSHLWSNADTNIERPPELDAYASALLDHAPAGLEHVCFVTAGGAEANEKALRIARMQGAPSRRRVLALRNSFHGRTLVALGATWNPAKREPFEWDGYEARFADADLDAIERALDEHGSEIYAVIAEPMMAEGGDVHLTRELFVGLRELTRARGIALVIDEVQTGFFTGGQFLWWQRLGLGEDPETAPDLLTIAKKAALGVVLSRWPDPEPAQVHVASAIRGLIHMQHAEEQAPIERAVAPRLQALASEFPSLGDPRVAGTTFAFDLADTAAVRAFIAQRFQRGFMTYPAGERTIRFRLNASWSEAHLDDLFRRIAQALRRLEDDGATTWVAEGAAVDASDVELRPIRDDDFPRIIEVGDAAYEQARRTPEATLRRCTEAGVALVATDARSGEILGFCFGQPLEDCADDGPKQDDTRGLGVTLYSADVTVVPEARGRGVGRVLKRAQLEWAMREGYRFVSGRNKVGDTDAMMALNRSFGAYPVAVYDGQYGGAAQAEYYRIPLTRPPDPDPAATTPSQIEPLCLASGIQRPFGVAPAFMRTRELVGPAASKLNLSNYATLDSVHYLDHLRSLLPRGTGHVYTTSSRDETVDKGLRCLRVSRPQGQIAIGLEGGYVGHTTAAARSLSDPVGFADDLALFDWPRIPHPSHLGVEATISALDAVVATHGPDRVLALVVEVVGERSGRALAGPAARTLARRCRHHDIPLVLVETATGCYRSGAGPWGLDMLPDDVVPDMVLWYPGGALGHVFVGDRYYVDKPLTLMSTWDGDELSMIRTHEHLRAARRIDTEAARAELDRMLVALTHRLSLAEAGGMGLYRTVSLQDAELAGEIHRLCLREGLRVGQGLPGTLIFAPPLDIDPALLRQGALNMLRRALQELRA